ncbi:MAG: SagB/ThcOx family dehydrogenase [Chloroflexi bacterium]|nr:SagB/ThcOx family dehydrogenase [Chloroflexota bacterium]
MAKKPLGRQYHDATKITPWGVAADQGWPRPPRPPWFKTYPGPKVMLPPPQYQGLTVEQALRQRRSWRDFAPRAISLAALGQLLFAAQGITGRYRDRPLRTAPSAGALYPYELYALVYRVRDLAAGAYYYDPRDHSLALVRAGDLRAAMAHIGLGQEHLVSGAVVFALSAVVDRVRSKYGERGWRYIYMEAGHISQNLYLQATSLGLGSVAVGAFYDDQMNALLGLDGEHETVMYLHAVGVLG